jgi:diguanylate cyclase (GGDEF)-like protein
VSDTRLIKDQEPPQGVPPVESTHPSEKTSEKSYATAALHDQEEARLASLMGFEIVDDETDPVLDGIAELAALALKAPISIITLVDKERVVFKSSYGIPCTSTPRDTSLCSFAILGKEDLFVIPDTHADPRFTKNPFVTGKPFVRFYAGAPLWDENHLPLGSLCVIDHEPREITKWERTMLVRLSSIAMARLTARRYRKHLEHLLVLEKRIYNKFLQSTAAMAVHFTSFDAALHELMTNMDPNLGWLSGRVRNMQTGGTTGIINNPIVSGNEELWDVWKRIDENPSHPSSIEPQTEFITNMPSGASYSHLVVPVRIRNRLVALLEFIYPDHRKTDQRIRDIFDLMASNLAIIAERELIHLELQHQATHDSLTDAANRQVIMSEIQHCLLNADPIQPDSAIAFLDLDGFKEVNDNFGHEVGDKLLIEVSKRLRGIAREQDIMGRLSGDEFVLILKKLHDPGDLPMLLERLSRALSVPYAVRDMEIRLTNSIGCTLINESEISPNEVLRRAEEAMYLVKKGHRKGYCIVDEEVISELHQRRHMDHKVREAMENSRMSLLHQPIVNFETGELRSAEALFRLLERDGKIMPAGEFMESLKRSRFLPIVDEWVLTEILRLIGAEGAPLLNLPGFRFSINVSPPILSTKDYATRFLEKLDKNGVKPTSLKIEITESELLASNSTVLQNLSRLRDMGVRLAVDDFGTGYSNLHYLSTLPIDSVKIDKSFLDAIQIGDQRMISLLRGMIGISQDLGYDTIVEGIETTAQEQQLRDMGCYLGQGYLYGKPMRIDELIEYSKRIRTEGVIQKKP